MTFRLYNYGIWINAFFQTMSDSGEKDIFFLQIAVLKKNWKKKKKKKIKVKKLKYWVREIFRKREENVDFTLVQEIKLGDREYYFR